MPLGLRLVWPDFRSQRCPSYKLITGSRALQAKRMLDSAWNLNSLLLAGRMGGGPGFPDRRDRERRENRETMVA